MDNQIIAAMVSGGCLIVGTVLGALIAKKNSFKLKKNRNGNYTLPEPFPCASVFYENVCSFSDSKQLTFDFGKFDISENNTAFVSLVYAFPNAMSFEKVKKLTFDISFKGSNCTQVDLEIKSDINSLSLPCKKTSEQDHFEVFLTEKMEKRDLRCVRELCYVIKPNYHENDDKCRGTVVIMNIVLT